MKWKYFKIGILILFGLAIIIPALLFVNALDWSKGHSARVADLPAYSDDVDSGEYRLQANGLEFLVRVAGVQNDGQAIILLHGFPESSLMWQPVLEAAAAKGYRVFAFDQRGYSPFARPKEVEDYQINHLVQDVIAIADAVGIDTFHLVGHDWGSGIGWKTVMDHPDRIHTWTAMSIPHIGVFSESLLTHPDQMKRSAYIYKLRRPFLPEFIFTVGLNKIGESMNGKWRDAEIAEIKAIQSEYGAISGALNWYRAMAIDKEEVEKLFNNPIIRPTLFIWGTEDEYVSDEIIPLHKDHINAPYQEIALPTGHSLIQAKTDTIIAAILNHIKQ